MTISSGVRTAARKTNDRFGPIRKAVTGGLTAGAAAALTAIQEITLNGVVVDAAFHITTNEWTVILGAVLAGLGFVYSIPNKSKPEPEEG